MEQEIPDAEVVTEGVAIPQVVCPHCGAKAYGRWLENNIGKVTNCVDEDCGRPYRLVSASSKRDSD